MDNYFMTVIQRFQGYGASPADLAEWFRVATDLNATLQFAARGYTPHQFEAIRDTHFSRFHGQFESDHPYGEDPAWLSWEDLLDTVPPDFLIRCLKAHPSSDDEIREWNRRRETGDPDIEAQIDTLGGLLADEHR